MKLTSTSERMKHPAYIKAMGTQKGKLTCIIIDTGCDKREQFRAAFHVSYLHNHTTYDKLEQATPTEIRDAYTLDIISLT